MRCRLFLVINMRGQARILKNYYQPEPDEVVFRINVEIPERRRILDEITLVVPELSDATIEAADMIDGALAAVVRAEGDD